MFQTQSLYAGAEQKLVFVFCMSVRKTYTYREAYVREGRREVGEIMVTFGSPKPYGIKVYNTVVLHASRHIVVEVVDLLTNLYARRSP